ncbi:S41 family peptidase [Paenibacillus larvae]|uniref:S41 family peptidase n=1 Tax=Paenibacillus larvae TaxID=1464 RepID=UPI0005A8F091|nr:S41 family peptidase [Paenibacillus larvae]AVG10618.1 carboxy-terminal processing protease CtpB [Paenibacillus larvae subsp. larvae DSM 25430]MDR5567589.1 S41 family peptidase [Paenibacillus larvae]MDR5594406.1 S41 family peptidase [Paenibacillus larvae]
MRFRGRTVLAMVLLAVLASSLLTLTVVRTNAFGLEGKVTGAAPAKASGFTSKDVDKLASTYQVIEEKFLSPVDHDKVINGAIHGMVQALEDPYTSYMDEKEAKQFSESISSSFEGIGAEVTSENGKIKVVSPIKNSPAEKTGIQANDIIVSVNGEKLDGLTVNQAVLKIRGEKGTEAKLEILRGGSGEPVSLTVIRDKIDVETVTSKMLDNKIGKIEITQFSTNTAKHFKEQLAQLESQGMKGLTIDVRNNPGGLLDSVVDIVQPFVPKGKAIVQIENKEGKKVPQLSEGDKTKNYPVTVLINKGSASASEILAGTFKEAVGSQVVGETSFGKGTVQTSKELSDGSNIKITQFKWLTPDGNWIHQKGIEPTKKVDPPAFYKAAPLSKKSVLKRDENGEDIKNAQLMLTAAGFKPDRTDGYFSAATEESVKAFQKAKGLTVSGQIDENTASKLERATIEAIKDPANDTQLQAALDTFK